MNNVGVGKTVKNVRKPRYIKLVITKAKRNYLVSEPNYLATKFLLENLIAIEAKKTRILKK